MRMRAQLRALGNNAPVAESQITSLADELSRLAGFDDEELTAGMTTLLRFGNLSAASFEKASRAAADLAAMTGVDLSTAFQQIGMALDNPEQGFGRLRRQIGDMTDAQKAAIAQAIKLGDVMTAQNIILDAISGKVQGAAAAYGNTLAGQMGKLQLLIGNIKEAIGGALIPGIVSALQTVMPYLQQFGQQLATVLGSPAMQENIRKLGVFIGTELVPMLQMAVEWMANEAPKKMEQFSAWFKQTGLPAMKETSSFVKSTLLPTLRLIADIMRMVWNVVGPIMNLWLRAWQMQINIFKTVTDQFNLMIKSIQDGITALQELVLPDWLTPGSPTPLEMGIRGITSAMKQMNGTAFTTNVGLSRLSPAGVMSGGGAPIILNYSPAISTASRQEAETVIVPFLRNAMRNMR
jgi:phage-related protein